MTEYPDPGTAPTPDVDIDIDADVDTGEYQDEHLEEAGSGTIRAGVFGVSDGLVSNTALVMGVAGGTSDSDTIILAGVAGLLAGAFSMAAGEYISVRTQAEVLQQELETEREHIREFPDEEERHLAVMLTEHGLSTDEARSVAAKVHQDVEPALGFHARFELGINPDDLGSPVKAAVSSFLAFIMGALVPLLPWFFSDSGSAILGTIVLSSIALAGVGALLTRFTPQKPLLGAARQLGVGAAAAIVTYGIGSLVGKSV